MALLLVALLVGLFADTALAGSGKVLRLAVGEWPPYLSADIADQGMVASAIRKIFAGEGYAVEFTFLPWARALVEAKEGRFDGTGVCLETNERRVDFLYSAAVLNERHVLFHLRKTPFDWTSVDDLKSKAIGGIVGFYYGEEFAAAEARGDLAIQRVTTDVQNFSKLLAGRVDVYPQERNVGLWVLDKHFTPDEVARVTFHPKVLMEKRSYLLFPKASPRSEELREAFDRGLKRMRDTGGYTGDFEYVR